MSARQGGRFNIARFKVDDRSEHESHGAVTSVAFAHQQPTGQTQLTDCNGLCFKSVIMAV